MSIGKKRKQPEREYDASKLSISDVSSLDKSSLQQYLQRYDVVPQFTKSDMRRQLRQLLEGIKLGDPLCKIPKSECVQTLTRKTRRLSQRNAKNSRSAEPHSEHNQNAESLQIPGNSKSKFDAQEIKSTIDNDGRFICIDCGNRANSKCKYVRCKNCCNSASFQCSIHTNLVSVPFEYLESDILAPLRSNLHMGPVIIQVSDLILNKFRLPIKYTH
eukprot:TRINITY_DN5410_c0_g1_i3.p1 TRINITY_DN5410_c0_g1~~TRINITY_DN5410_c0_g1_i3.p1  ORF type:complete len:216 (-),score=18.55 TRINITY_DN5410_c0_g1_i3:4-651(-)